VSDSPSVQVGHRIDGVAGQYAYSVTVKWPDEAAVHVRFTGSIYGGPIIVSGALLDMPISQGVLDRIGRTLSPEWIERFYRD
jgi:hypothetical protein